jgi:hypothetical protein
MERHSCGRARTLCGKCVPCFEKSVASAFHGLRERHIEYSNQNDSPALLTFLKCGKHKLWKCLVPECGHTFVATCNKVLGAAKTNCPYCCLQKMCDCTRCTERSVASALERLRVLGIDYSADNTIAASLTARRSNQLRSWKCLNVQCNHTFSATSNNIVSESSGCPFCSTPSRKLCDCAVCFSKTIAADEEDLRSRNIKYSDENAVPAKSVFRFSNAIYIWKCINPDCMHSFKSTAGNITAGHGCSYCCNTHRSLCECMLCFAKSVGGAKDELSRRQLEYSDDNTVPAHLTAKQTNTKNLAVFSMHAYIQCSVWKCTGFKEIGVPILQTQVRTTGFSDIGTELWTRLCGTSIPSGVVPEQQIPPL